MQLFFERSDEDHAARGLGLIPGTVRRLGDAVRVPHVGWNEVRTRRAHPWLATAPDGAHFYFVHSYAPDASGEATVATTDHGTTFASIVGGDGYLGLQFHPERSSLAGTRLLQSVLRAIG
jgi:glutamine amidotransferase